MNADRLRALAWLAVKYGVVAAGVILGVLTTFTSAFLGSYISTIALFGAAIIVLLVKPEGIQ